jgi:hypothetical protein
VCVCVCVCVLLLVRGTRDAVSMERNYEVYVGDLGARGTVVVKALCYKPVGRGFDTQWGEF